MLPVLYTFRRCPYAIRARYIIALLGVSVYMREVVLKSKPDSLLKLGGRSSVPQLIDIDGERYSESLDIIFWSLNLCKGSDIAKYLWPNSIYNQNKIMAWVRYNDHFFKYWLDRYKYSDRYPELSESYYRSKGEIFLKRLDIRLEKRPFLFGNNPCIADIAIFPFVRQFAAVDSDWFESLPYCSLQKWLEDFIESDIFKTVMTKVPAWKEGQENICFPS